jgi:hypothetical protein
MKASDPAGGAGFEFTGDLGDFTLDDGESQTFSDLAEDDYDVTEIIPSGWDLRNVTCTGGDYDAIPGGVTIHLDPGEDVSCTYNNEIPGSITSVKETDPSGFAGFGFTGDLGDFTLDDGQGQIFTDLPSGDYDITEILPSGWKLSEVICTGGDFDE